MDQFQDLKTAIEAANTAAKAYRDANDARLAALEQGQSGAAYEAKLEKIEAELRNAEAAIARMNLSGGLPGTKPQPSAVAREFAGWAASDGKTGAFRATVNTEQNIDGGFILVPELETGITRVADAEVAMRRVASVRTIRRASLELLVSKGGASAGWVKESGSRSGNTATPDLAAIEIFAHEIYAEPKSTQAALEDLDVDVASWLGDEAGIAMAEAENAAFISGDGVEKPRGFLAHTIVANGNYVWGKIGYTASGSTSGFSSTDKLIELVHSLKPSYRNNAVFLMSDTTLADIRKLKDGQNNYLWQPDYQAGVSGTLLGKRIETDDNMPTIGANSYSIAFGDFRAGYQIVDRVGISVLRDPYTEKGFVKFYTRKRVGGDVRNFEAIKLMKFQTS